MSSDVPKKVFDSIADLRRLHEERARQIFEAETRLRLIRQGREEDKRRYAALQEEHRVVDVALQASKDKVATLEETLVQRTETLKILEREIDRSEKELSQIQDEANAEMNKLKERAEIDEKRRQESTRNIWNKFPGYVEFIEVVDKLEEVRNKVVALEAVAEQKRAERDRGRKKMDEIERKRQTLEALKNQLKSLNSRKAELEARNEMLLRGKAAAKEVAIKAAQEAAAKAAEETASRLAQEAVARRHAQEEAREAAAKEARETAAKEARETAAKEAQEAAARRHAQEEAREAAAKEAQEAAARRYAQEAQEAAARRHAQEAHEAAARRHAQEVVEAADEAAPTEQGREDEMRHENEFEDQDDERDDDSQDYFFNEDSEARSRDANWTLPVTESAPPLMKLSAASTAGSNVSLMDSLTVPTKSQYFSTSLAESTPASHSRLFGPSTKMAIPAYTPIFGQRLLDKPAPSQEMFSPYFGRNASPASKKQNHESPRPTPEKCAGPPNKHLLDLAPRVREKSILISPDKDFAISGDEFRRSLQTPPRRASNLPDQMSSFSSPTPPKVRRSEIGFDFSTMFTPTKGDSTAAAVSLVKQSVQTNHGEDSIMSPWTARPPQADTFAPTSRAETGGGMSNFFFTDRSQGMQFESAVGQGLFLTNFNQKPDTQSEAGRDSGPNAPSQDDVGRDIFSAFGSHGGGETSTASGDNFYNFGNSSSSFGNSTTSFFGPLNDGGNNQGGTSNSSMKFNDRFGGGAGEGLF